jgi:hypothetical protein
MREEALPGKERIIWIESFSYDVVSEFQSFRVSRFQGFRVSEFQSFRISEFKVSFLNHQNQNLKDN